MKTLNILVPMKLHGQAGYAMAMLLVAMAIMAVMMTVAMPVWKQAARRDKEEELVFRGLQYAHAIGLFQKKYANAFPPNLDVLVSERFLRRKYKDPITNDDFALILAGQNTATPQQPAGGGRSGQPTTTRTTTPSPASQPAAIGGAAQGRGGIAPGVGAGRGGAPVGGIMGVTSKSKDVSIRLYKGRNHYNEWQFVFVPQVQAPGAGGVPGTGAPGQRGNPPNPFAPNGGPGGPRGRGGQGGRPTGPGGRGGGPGSFNPFQLNNPQPPAPRGRG